MLQLPRCVRRSVLPDEPRGLARRAWRANRWRHMSMARQCPGCRNRFYRRYAATSWSLGHPRREVVPSLRASRTELPA